MTTRAAIRDCIGRLLGEHVSDPFLNLREAGLQARLWSHLQRSLSPDTLPARIVLRGGASHRHTGPFRTARVQLEMRVGSAKRTDIVVLRADRQPQLTCYPPGPTDVVAALDPDDVEAVIEVKAAPSRVKVEPPRFAQDVIRLGELQARHRHMQAYFVLVDKSLSVPGATSVTPADDTWVSLLKEGRLSSSEPQSRAFVEVWDLHGSDGLSARTRFWIPAEGTAEPLA